MENLLDLKAYFKTSLISCFNCTYKQWCKAVKESKVKTMPLKLHNANEKFVNDFAKHIANVNQDEFNELICKSCRSEMNIK